MSTHSTTWISSSSYRYVRMGNSLHKVLKRSFLLLLLWVLLSVLAAYKTAECSNYVRVSANQRRQGLTRIFISKVQASGIEWRRGLIVYSYLRSDSEVILHIHESTYRPTEVELNVCRVTFMSFSGMKQLSSQYKNFHISSKSFKLKNKF